MRVILSTTLIALLPVVYGHGRVTSPPARAAGPAFGAACSAQVLNQQQSDQNGNVQGELQVATSQKDYNPSACNMFLCKGFQFADNTANVQTYTLSQTIPFTAVISAPHTGTANVSVVDTAANTIIGDQLIYFADYASTAHTIPANNTKFDVKLPADLGGKCTQPGECVLQWWWDSPEAKQTYESCVDFVVGGGGGAAAPVAAPVASSAAPAAAPVASSSAAPAAAPAASAAAPAASPVAGTADEAAPGTGCIGMPKAASPSRTYPSGTKSAN
ncbi:hypothetical protein EJ06DRAFT_534238 [Trichodelitschia bisporula]|uniref:Chitin-binding type-4 domain-containing protein n=1 Tax=Trichodelitschia bisporula TaxID=703511 RepID=A0A6G1HJM5_9PEZI|nr:hypothetical protein EJ06DRAFT_534238 [Trichodelitschia bisporula]